MSVRAYRVLPATALAAVAASIRNSVVAWSDDWGLGEPAIECWRAWATETAELVAPGPCLRLAAGDGVAWLCWRSDPGELLLRAMFASDRVHGQGSGTPDIAGEAAQAALDALVAALSRTLAGQPVERGAVAALPAAVMAPGSGAVLVALRCRGFAMSLLLEYAIVRRIVAPADAAGVTPPLSAVDYVTLLADQPVRLPVEAGRATVGLGSLLRLAPGDVIRLDALLEQPLALAAEGGTVIARGYLGIQDHYFALDLVAGCSSSGESP